MINNVVLVGRLTRDPELRYSSSNLPMVYFTLAVNRTFTDQNGQKNADFINCVTFRKQAENMARFLAKGSLIGLTGRIQTRNYQGKDGNMVYTTEVVADNIQYLEPKNSSNQNNTVNDDFNFNNSNQSGNFNPNYQQQGFNMQGSGVGLNSGFSNQFNQNMNANSNFADFGQDFPSNDTDDDFLADVVNPFKD